MKDPFDSFDFELFEHETADDLQAWLDGIRRHARLIELEAGVFRAECDDESSVAEVGLSRFNTALARRVRVIGVAGNAVLRASAYPHPASRAGRKKHRASVLSHK